MNLKTFLFEFALPFVNQVIVIIGDQHAMLISSEILFNSDLTILQFNNCM